MPTRRLLAAVLVVGFGCISSRASPPPEDALPAAAPLDEAEASGEAFDAVEAPEQANAEASADATVSPDEGASDEEPALGAGLVLPPGLPESRRSEYALCLDADEPICSLAEELRDGSLEVDPDPQLALELFERTCAAGAAWDCDNAARLLVSGRLGLRDLPRAIALARAGCRRQEVLCGDLAELLQAPGPTRDDAAARAALEDGCSRGCDWCCRDRAERAEDDSGAEPWLTLGCHTHGHEASCEALAELLRRTGQPERARAAARDACLLGSLTSCEETR